MWESNLNWVDQRKWQAYRYWLERSSGRVEILVWGPSEAQRKRTFVVHAAHLGAARR